MPHLTGERVVVTGLGVSGEAASNFLIKIGANVTVVDESDGVSQRERAARLPTANVILGRTDIDLNGVALVVTSPGWRPQHPLLHRAAEIGIEVIGDVELAWRIDLARTSVEGTQPPKWLGLTGTNGKTTTVRMLESILKAAGLRSKAVGNVGESVIDAVLEEERFEALALELSSFQLHWAKTLKPTSAALLNLAEDHLDWHGSFEAYIEAKTSLLRSATNAIGNRDDEITSRVLDSIAKSHTYGFTLGTPRRGEVGVVEELLVDRAFTGTADAEELAELGDVKPWAPHNISNALAAAALARSIGVSATAVRDGLRKYVPDAHRLAEVATADGITWIDDSKATNPHAAGAALRTFDSVIWIAGGLAKGAAMDDLVAQNAHRIKAAVLIGADREIIAEALSRHAPHVPVFRVDPPDTEDVKIAAQELMKRVVTTARSLSGAGDTVLLAPACASMDQFSSYAHRGDAFAAAALSEQ
jgi:UDP-N-acetylmuramoylalanine--D-glutamate ligase